MKNLLLFAVLASLLLMPGCSGSKKPAVVKPVNPRIFATLQMRDSKHAVTSIGHYSVVIMDGDGDALEQSAFISIAYTNPDSCDETVVWSRKTYPMTSIHVVDLNNDQCPELYINEFSGGAHCCSQHIVLQLDPVKPKVTKLLDWDGQDVDMIYPGGYEFLSGSNYAEIITADYRFRYFSDLSFGTSPAINKIFSFRGGKYVSATSEFPDRVRKWRQEQYDKVLKLKNSLPIKGDSDYVKRATTREEKNIALASEQEWEIGDCKTSVMTAYVYGVMLGEEKETLKYLRKAAPPVANDWLIQNKPAADKLIKESPL
ncbi:MAG: hypothetical protein WCL39_11785 [Armatimonadota bacterium]